MALGLTLADPILAKASGYMLAVLEGRQARSDRVDKTECWPIGVEAITAGMLAEVDPGHPALEPAWTYWMEIASRCFPAGSYD